MKNKTFTCQSESEPSLEHAELCFRMKRQTDEAARIGGDTILACLDGLPKGQVHCAFLAAGPDRRQKPLQKTGQ